MKALILAGGKGTRLRPITHTSAKQLVPIANKPILFYGLESIAAAGITDIGVIVGDTRTEIRRALGDGSRWGINITYIEQEAPLGLAHAVKIARPFIGDDDFIMYLGDNLIKDDLSLLVKEFTTHKPQAQILLAHVPHPENFGVATLRGADVVRLEEKPAHPESDLALVGIYMFDKAIFEAVENIKPSARNELEITDAIQYLIDKNFAVRARIVGGWWKDTGKLEDILEANSLVLETLTGAIAGSVDELSCLDGKVIVEKGARIINSSLRGPVIIGSNTTIINSYIGPFTSIYHSVTIENSEIEHSIVLENSSIKDVKRIEDSLIGQNVVLLRTQKKPAAYRIMAGDSSRVEII
ncbi:MAG: glucose-1-phosphate thymidylyltransferase [Elusimicrobia bacterium RIFOXYA2_FULL_50_26]|nr:MAG: glucose-1-phosphate thymidylyltransferase [Elusimicrobia bacterium RIFOXYA2_FULL_50_26]OGS24940.1 MAG: glucose-1-phosphate thymidylyltransferase [Elusimicrobia bacterium RIFOXYB2_FULL_50_12]